MHEVGPSSNMTGVLTERGNLDMEVGTHTQRMPLDGRDWGDKAEAKDLQRLLATYQELVGNPQKEPALPTP